MLALLAILAVGQAHAGACCVGAMSTVPTRLGECETWMAGLGLGGETSFGQWTSQGQVAASSLQDDALVATLAGAWRWDRKGQVGLTLPGRLNHKATDELQAWGSGVGDLRIIAGWDPVEEQARGGDRPALPVPYLTAGLRLPTGRSWQDADGVLLEGVTGLPGPALLLGASAERTMGRLPWSVGLDAELDVADDHVHPALTAWGNLGLTLSREWSLNSTLGHTESFSLDGDERAARTTVAAQVAYGRRLRWRTWGGVESDLPIPGLGTSNLQLLRVRAGVAVVR